jgi:hypothetical protein
LPSGTLGMIRAMRLIATIGTSTGGLSWLASVTWPCASVASAHHPLARRSPHDGGLAGLLKRP